MIATIDPGLNEAGWALLSLSRRKNHNPLPVILAAGVVKDKSAQREMRVMRIAYKSAHAIAVQYEGMQYCSSLDYTASDKLELITRVVIEWPQLRSDAVSHAAAAKGDLQMLTMMAGACMAYLHEMLDCPDCPCNLITPSEWKGQLSKVNTQKRLERFFGSPLRCNGKYGNSKVLTHAVDAVGMGLHAMGFPMDCALWRRE